MKVPPFASVAVFAEDIRQEVSGQVSIVGIMPDNITVPNIPGMLPKLAVYVRSVIDVKADAASDLAIALVDPAGTEITRTETSREVIYHSRHTSILQGNDVHILISQMTITPFPMVQEGRFRVVAYYGGEEYLSGSLNCEKVAGESAQA